MAGFLQYIYPSDPNAVYKVSSICAEWGLVSALDLSSRSVGVLIASFLRELINNYVYGGFDSTLCSDEKIKVGKRVRVECRLSIAHVLRIFLEEGLALLSGTRYRI